MKILDYVYRKTFSWKIFGESVSLIKFIGISFIILGMGAITPAVDLTTMAIFSFSISGIFFVLSDIAKHYREEWDAKKALGTERMFKVKIYHFLNVVFLFAGIFFLICGPFVKLDILIPHIEKIGPALAFIAIGLTIMKIGLENEKKNTDMMVEITDEVSEVIQDYEKKLEEK